MTPLFSFPHQDRKILRQLQIASLCCLLTSTMIMAEAPAPAPTAPAPAPAPEKSIPSSPRALHLEKLIATVRKTHPDMNIIKTFEADENGREADKVIYLLPETRDTRIMTIDSITGEVIRDRSYVVPKGQKKIPLEILLADLRGKYSITKIIRTRQAKQNGRDVRIIIYLDKTRQQRLMAVDTQTGEVVSDNARKFLSKEQD